MSAPTCLTCGKPLVMEYTHDWDSTNVRGERKPMWAQPGYRGNGLFCTLRCGYGWAVANAPRWPRKVSR